MRIYIICFLLVALFVSFMGCIQSDLGDSEYERFYEAARSQDITLLDKLIKDIGSIDAVDSKGRSLIYWSSINGYSDFVNHLLKKGANPHLTVSWKDEQTALHAAAMHGHIGVMEHLLQAGMAVDLETRHQVTPLILAARNAQPDAVAFLISRGASVWHTDYWGKTGLHDMMLAENENHLMETISILIRAGADVNARSVDGETPLMQMSQICGVRILEMLLQHGADPKAQNDFGVSVLLYAKDNKMAYDLLREGPDGKSLRKNRDRPEKTGTGHELSSEIENGTAAGGAEGSDLDNR